MAPVVDLERPRLVESKATTARLAESSMTVVTVTEAGSDEVRLFRFAPFLRGEDYPALARVWDNDDDAVFDTM